MLVYLYGTNKKMIFCLVSVIGTTLLVSNVESLWFERVAGPFKIDFKRAEKCPPGWEGQHAVNFSYQTRPRQGLPTLYSGGASIPFVVDDSLALKGSITSFTNGGWKGSTYQAQFSQMCKLAETRLRRHWDHFMTLMFGETGLSCPFPPGIYRIWDVKMEEWYSQTPFFKTFIYAKWRGEGRVFTKSGEQVSCARAYFDTVPK